MRTHAFTGQQGIEMLIGSAMATSHCYMIYPAITMAGQLLSPMYVLVSEARGQFPQKHSDPPNIKSYASKTANMNKADLKTFYQEVFWPSVNEHINTRKILLLVDSWSPHKDEELFNSVKPPGIQCEKKIIPANATNLIQPLDIYFFRPYKNFVKFFTDSVIDEEEFDIWSRANFLKLQSFTLYTFQSERFKNMILYAFYKSGYRVQKPDKCETPIEFCFKNVALECEQDNCEALGFIRCAYCVKTLCLKHTIGDELHIECQQ